MAGLNEADGSAGLSREKVLFKLDFLELKIEQLERKVTRKADEVVSVQVLQHRSELESIYETIHGLNVQMKKIDDALTQILQTDDTVFNKTPERKRSSRMRAESTAVLPSL